MKMETYEVKYENQILGRKEIETKYFYSTKQNLVKCITLYEYEHLISIKVVNKGNDTTKHREITKEELKKYL